MNIVFLGIDLAKNVFQLCGLNQAGKRYIQNALAAKNYARQSLIYRLV